MKILDTITYRGNIWHIVDDIKLTDSTMREQNYIPLVETSKSFARCINIKNCGYCPLNTCSVSDAKSNEKISNLKHNFPIFCKKYPELLI